MNHPSPRLYTIGHSNRPWDTFLAVLQRNGVTTVVDVRSVPYSRRFPWFARERLAAALGAAGIDYRYMGAALGGRPRDRALWTPEGEPDYGRMRHEPAYGEALARLVALAHGTPGGCVMCSEGDPRRCHRHHLLEPDLLRAGVAVRHIPRPPPDPRR